MGQFAAVLTGDLIASTAGGPDAVDATMRLLGQCANEVDAAARFTRFRGDGWQMILHDPGRCLWGPLYILAKIRAGEGVLGTRISVGIGEVVSLGREGLGAASGPAFTAAGEGLEAMPRDRMLTLTGKAQDAAGRISDVDAFQKAVFAFADDRLRRWSREQAEAMALALDPRGPHIQEEMARRLGITRQAVGLRLKAAGHHLLDAASQAFALRYNTYLPDTPQHV